MKLENGNETLGWIALWEKWTEFVFNGETWSNAGIVLVQIAVIILASRILIRIFTGLWIM